MGLSTSAGANRVWDRGVFVAKNRGGTRGITYNKRHNLQQTLRHNKRHNMGGKTLPPICVGFFVEMD